LVICFQQVNLLAALAENNLPSTFGGQVLSGVLLSSVVMAAGYAMISM
jgi:hypothetical protein